MRDLTKIVRQAQKLRGRAETQVVPEIALVDATSLLDAQSWSEFASADPLTREGMRRQQAELEGRLVAEQTAGLPEGTGGRITAILVACPLPPEEEAWRVTDDASLLLDGDGLPLLGG